LDGGKNEEARSPVRAPDSQYIGTLMKCWDLEKELMAYGVWLVAGTSA